MELTIEIPEGVKIELEKFKVKVIGSKGTLEKDFYNPLFSKKIKIEKNDNKILIKTDSKRSKIKSMSGTIKSHILNMIKGVTEGFTAKLKMVYMHFPFTVKISGKEILVNNFLGEKTSRKTTIVDDCKVEIKGDEIVVTGINKESVGQTAANLEKATWIKARDRRVFQDGCFITEKPK